MNIKHSSAFSKCYIMQHEDIERFADSKEVNSVLIYIRPKSKEPNILCYLKAGNVDLYKHFQFELKEQVNIKSGNLTLFAMHRKSK